MGFQQILNKFIKEKKPKTLQVQEYYGEAKTLKKSLTENIKIIKDLLGDPPDLKFRDVMLGSDGKTDASIIAFDGLTDDTINDIVLKSIILEIRQSKLDKTENEEMIEVLKNHSLPMNSVEFVYDFKQLCESLLNGNSVILLEDTNRCLSIDTKVWKDRGVTEPQAETVVRGARDSFNETLRTNTTLVRKRVKDINLRMMDKNIGTVTKTNVSVMFIEGIANHTIVQDLMDRLDLINIDGIFESSNIEELILDEPSSVFPTMYATERPDKVAANLLEGRIAVFTDGTPFVLILPAVFIQFFQSVEDYYHRSVFSSFIRLIRFFAFFLALLTPAAYLAITTFHQEMLPTPLIISISGQREAVPFPAVVEVLLMEITFEILREAGLRMPRAIGSAISIVGALVLGEAAVQAGIVSNIMVIIVAITAISSLIFPDYTFSNPIRILRFLFIAAASVFGLFGISIGLMLMAIHLCSLRSFGVPYMYPIAPFNWSGIKDSLIRAPLNRMKKRPTLMTEDDIYRQNDE
jgi:spore germination protein KA